MEPAAVFARCRSQLNCRFRGNDKLFFAQGYPGLILLLCFGILWASPARADQLPSSDSLKQALAVEDAGIGDYGLDEEGLNAFYAVREYRPVWNFSGAENSAVFAAFTDSIDKAVQYHGLLADSYPLDLMRKLAAASDDDSRLKLELLASDTLLRLAHDLHGDDLDLDPLFPGWNFHRAPADIPRDLESAVATNTVNEMFERLTPKIPAYRELAGALKLYRELAAKGNWPVIDSGPILKLGDHGPRVAQLRARLEAEGHSVPAEPGEEPMFDAVLADRLTDYQLHNGLKADGHLGPDTRASLNIPVTTRIDQILANMERWRHMPDDFPPPRAIIVNIGDASIEILNDGKPVYDGIVIVGQVVRKTPFIQSAIRSMIVNPSWHVPSKIARADILPKLREDPHYLEKLGFVIRDSEDDPHGENIDWKNMPDEEFNFRLRQEPGTKNSLGRLKLDFNNEFAVYLHGTPHQELFDKDKRTLSSGCVRLREPEKVASFVLADTPGAWDVAHIEDAIAAKKTRWVGVKTPMPLYILYWTVFADAQGRIEFRNDAYGYDKFLMENLRGNPPPSESASHPSATP